MNSSVIEIGDKIVSLQKIPKTILIIDHTHSAKINIITKICQNLNINLYDYNANPGCNIKPDLVLLINKTFRFFIKNPLLIAKAELFHSKMFSIDVFVKSLIEYSKAKINNGL